MTTVYILLGIIAALLLGIIVFIWWQFSFTDSRLCKLIDSRSTLLDVDDLLDEEPESEGDNNEYL